MEKEVSAIDSVLKNAKHPFTAIIGGSKVSSKLGVIKNLLDKVDNLIIGGGMGYTFIKADVYKRQIFCKYGKKNYFCNRHTKPAWARHKPLMSKRNKRDHDRTTPQAQCA